LGDRYHSGDSIALRESIATLAISFQVLDFGLEVLPLLRHWVEKKEFGILAGTLSDASGAS